MMANNWSNKSKNNFDQPQYQISSGSGAKGLELAKGLEPIAKPDI